MSLKKIDGDSLSSSFVSSNSSLPSLSCKVHDSSKLMGFDDFSGSIPMFHNRRADIWGDIEKIPKFGVFQSLNNRHDNESREKKKIVDSDGDTVSTMTSISSSIGGVKHGKDRRNSLLKMGFLYQSEKELPKSNEEASKVVQNDEKNSGKISLHSTTIRNLRPERKTKIKKVKDEEAAPLPRVHSRRIVETRRESITEAVAEKRRNTKRRIIVSKKSSLVDFASDFISAIGQSNSESLFNDNEVWSQYFGTSSRQEFYTKYSECSSIQSKYSDKNLPDELKSPRSKYLQMVSANNLTPLPLILRSEAKPKGVFLGHRGLGDDKVLPVIEVLDQLPIVETIDLSDNRLTDKSLMPLALKLEGLQSLTHLDLSFNKIDDSSSVIMKYLSNTRCKLTHLLLNGADVDDDECANLAQAIADNRSITSLSLTNNMIGANELLNVVNPDLITGGEALGDMLSTNNTLKFLDLSWNFIRLESAITLADSLLTNKRLHTLILAYNGFGDLPTQYIGQALKTNTSMTYLDLSYNSINPKSATVIANALIHNDYMCNLVLDGNTLGNVGAQALVAAVQRASGDSRVLRIGFSNCDCTQEAKEVFNASNPSGTYTVDLSEPYGQMVAEECLYLANYRAGCHLIKWIYEGSNCRKEHRIERLTKHNRKGENIDSRVANLAKLLLKLNRADTLLIKNQIKDILEYFELFSSDEYLVLLAQRMLQNLRDKIKLAGSLEAVIEEYCGSVMFELFLAMFQVSDADNNAFMDVEEFVQCLLSLGVELERKYAKKLMRDFDTDKSGTIDSFEFSMIMVNEFCRADASRGELVDAQTKKPVVIPSKGYLTVTMFYQCELASIHDVSHDEGIHSVIRAIQEAKNADQREVLFEHATTSPYYLLSAQQALMLFEEMGKHGSSEMDVLARVMPQLVNSEQCHRFIDSVLNYEGKFALRVQLGQIYNCFMGLPCGHYLFDLRVKQRLVEGRILSAVWSEETRLSRKKGLNTSQRGDYSNFRNEAIGANKIDLTAHWFAKCTTNTGKLRLDYVSTRRPRLGILPLSEKRFNGLMQRLQLNTILEYQKNKNYDEITINPVLTLVHLKEYCSEYMLSSHHHHSIYPVERCRETRFDPDARPVTPDSLKDVEFTPTTKMFPIFPYAYTKLLELQLALPTIHLSMQQVIHIMLQFPEDNYLRVQAFISMFSVIVDYDKNGVKFLSYLTEDERQEIYHRLGILNIVDTVNPDLLYRLDLRRWEHRQMCKILIVLAVEEPGDNWIGVEYRWSKYDPNVPGWSLPVLWLSKDEENNGEGGPRKFGWLSLRYVSDGPGCVPVMSVRMEQRKQLLVGMKRDPMKVTNDFNTSVTDLDLSALDGWKVQENTF